MPILPNQVWSTLFPESVPSGTSYTWSDQATRLNRYRILSAFADGTVYSGPDAQPIREKFRAYKKVRPIYNPCGRIVEFHASHLMGGGLDGDAGPGPEHGGPATALPIIAGGKADQKVISRSVASIWRASNWQVRKTYYTRTGASLGDVGLEMIADTDRKLVRLRVVHPAEIVDKEEDAYGNLRYYALERWVRDDDDPSVMVKYREIVTNTKGRVTIATFKGPQNTPHQWPGTQGQEWTMKWSFIPMVMVKHIDIGLPYGQAEHLHAIPKSVERDSQGSGLSDGVLKSIVGKWALMGPSPPRNPRTGKPEKLVLDDVSGDEEGIVYLGEGRSIEQMVIALQIAEASAHGESISQALADDYPEMLADGVGLNASGEARKEARRKASNKITERRAAYDDCFRRAMQMGMTMGGILGFDEFPFNSDSFDKGLMDFAIGSRPVFEDDPTEQDERRKAKVDIEKVKADTFKTYFEGGQGTTLVWALRKVGATDKEIEELKKELAEEEAKARELQSDTVPADQPVDAGPIGVFGT